MIGQCRSNALRGTDCAQRTPIVIPTTERYHPLQRALAQDDEFARSPRFQHRQVAQHHQAVAESLLGPDQQPPPAQVPRLASGAVVQQLPDRRRDAEILVQDFESALIQLPALPRNRRASSRASTGCTARSRNSAAAAAPMRKHASASAPTIARIEDVAQRDLRRRIVVANRQRLPATGLRLIQRCVFAAARTPGYSAHPGRPAGAPARPRKDSASSSRSSRRSVSPRLHVASNRVSVDLQCSPKAALRLDKSDLASHEPNRYRRKRSRPSAAAPALPAKQSIASSSDPRSLQILPRLLEASAFAGLSRTAFLNDASASSTLPTARSTVPRLLWLHPSRAAARWPCAVMPRPRPAGSTTDRHEPSCGGPWHFRARWQWPVRSIRQLRHFGRAAGARHPACATRRNFGHRLPALRDRAPPLRPGDRRDDESMPTSTHCLRRSRRGSRRRAVTDGLASRNLFGNSPEQASSSQEIGVLDGCAANRAT